MSAYGIPTTAMPTHLPADFSPPEYKEKAEQSPSAVVVTPPIKKEKPQSLTKAKDYFNHLVGKPSDVETQAKTGKKVAPEAWTISQTQDLLDTFPGAYRLLNDCWPLKSKLPDAQKKEVIDLFKNGHDSLTEIELILQEKIDSAVLRGRAGQDKLDADAFNFDEIEKLEEFPELLETIQAKSEGLYEESDSLDKRTGAALAAGGATFLLTITGIVFAAAGTVTMLPAIGAALVTLSSLIAAANFYVEDKNNKAEAKAWGRGIKGLTNLGDGIKKLKESEMWGTSVQARDIAQGAQARADQAYQLAQRTEQGVALIAQANEKNSAAILEAIEEQTSVISAIQKHQQTLQEHQLKSEENQRKLKAEFYSAAGKLGLQSNSSTSSLGSDTTLVGSTNSSRANSPDFEELKKENKALHKKVEGLENKIDLILAALNRA